ncbi:MAG TPA: O-antigen ligase family protein [Pelagibacterium sp.]|uniref:O-antigen ligase family protein n=1 Tax=Pelagibacterium sp. TaxID=1967288 RepID=UPI002B6CBA92|nr:O-antigen ligase family protein [Pelagibacterium sp.]HWJ88941.1 O-antigen ligase family protein [Pelagibacterium sp.]
MAPALIFLTSTIISVMISGSSGTRAFQIFLCILAFFISLTITTIFFSAFIKAFLATSSIFFIAYFVDFAPFFLGLTDWSLTAYVRGSNIRMEGLLESPNYFGMTSFGTLVIALAFHTRAQEGIAFSAAAFSGVLLSLSRAVLLACIFIIGLRAFLNPKKALKFVAGFIVSGGAAIAFLAAFRPSAIQSVYNRFSDQGGGANERIEVTLGAMKAAFAPDHILFGYGLWPYREFGFSEPPHNAYATIFVDQGLVGLGALLSFFGLTAFLVAKSTKGKARRNFFIYLAGLALVLLFNDFHIYRDWWVSLGAVLGIAFSRTNDVGEGRS